MATTKQKKAKAKAKRRAHVPTPEEVQRRRKVMTDEEWDKRQENERKLKIRSAKNSRTMFVRYMSSVVFFINIYWLALLSGNGFTNVMIVPAINVLCFAAAAVETFTILSKDSCYLKVTHYACVASILLDAFVLLVTPLWGKDVFFPFFSSGIVGAVVCALMVTLKLLIVRKVLRVRDCKDKAYDRYLELLSE